MEIIITKREIAMIWWNDRSADSKELMARIYFDRMAYTLTGREIEHIYDKIVSR